MPRKIITDFIGCPIGASDGDISIMECEKRTADKIVIANHYSHKATKNTFKSFLVNDGQGVLQLGYGIRPALKSKIHPNITKENYCEFDRMWLSDDMPKFSESRVIGLLLFYIKAVYPQIEFIITYADESAGNKGTIYKATNAFKVGSIPVDFYVLESGERVHPVSMYHRHGSRSKETMERIYPNIQHIKGKLRHNRFLYILNKKTKREFTKQYVS
jgi:hypothetical protein